MRTALMVTAVFIVLAGIFGFTRGVMNPFSMVVAIVAISVFGGVLRESAKHGRGLKGAAQKDLAEINERIARIEDDIADIKEQIADFIINQV